MKLADLPDIDFVDIDTDTVEQALFDSYSNITGRTLAQGDPIRLFILFVADVIIQIKNNVNTTGKQNLLKYSTGDNLDNLAAMLGVTRIAASAATTTIKATLSAVRTTETIIPAGTRISPEGSIYFATDKALTITAENTTGTVAATCTTTGISGNGYQAGEISSIVDPIAYVASMVNTTKSEGGAAIETDDALRERVFEAPESFSCAGPSGAYAYHAKSVNSSIIDVSVSSPTAGSVQIVPLLTDGTIPGTEIINEVLTKLSADDIRPLTDNVTVIAPTAVSYDVTATYYIDSDADAATVKNNVATAVSSYTAWQRAALGRDINPSKLIQLVMAVSGVKRIDVTAPVFTEVSDNQVAQSGTVSVTMSGSEPE